MERPLLRACVTGAVVLAAAAVGATVGRVTAPSHPGRPTGDAEPTRLLESTKRAAFSASAPGLSAMSATGSCGIELWGIKTLTDSQAGQVDLAPQVTSIAALDAIPPPTANPNRVGRAPAELQTWTVTATLTGFVLEADSDYHLILSDGAGHSMIAEIPDPACASGSRVLSEIGASRAAFEASGHTGANQCFSCLSQTVTVTGVGFFDVLHGQNGVAPNGVELHPIVSFAMGGAPLPPPPVTTSPVTTTAPATTTPTTTAVVTTTPTPSTDDGLDELPGCSKYPDHIYHRGVKQNHCQASYFTTP